MALKTSKRAEKKAQELAAEATSTVEAKADKALSELSKLASTVGPVVSEGAKEFRGKAEGLVDQYRPLVEDNIRTQSEKLSSLSEKLGPQADRLKHDLQEDYLPRAKRTAAATNTVVTAAVTAAVDAARKEIDKGQSDIRSAALTPVAAPKKKGRAGKVLLVLGLAAVGAAAGYVAWKKTRPVEDPWAPPADFARAHYPASGSTDSDSSAVSDSVGSAEAGDVAESLKDSAADASGDAAKRGSHRGDA
ncbi:hypothetical protein [Brachybacterium phenoliresistens]|uniref:Uncharacterized protein n=1 Tax=Brachybacterium phenoliresistens TaxID=396014 RepID=Z9JR99_9MICO|nr:hypothetical protein [Brachybacterium phenoliresistens]EWS80336.1 hypothetical protein BF93_03915 [Brachybacterium phenoliresistens]